MHFAVFSKPFLERYDKTVRALQTLTAFSDIFFAVKLHNFRANIFTIRHFAQNLSYPCLRLLFLRIPPVFTPKNKKGVVKKVIGLF